MMFKLPNSLQIILLMSKKIFALIILVFFNYNVTVKSEESSKFLNQGKKNFEKKKYEEAQIDFEKYIVRYPKDFNGYLYLSKIFKIKKQNDKYEKNLNTVLLLEPKNEEALYMIVLKKLTDGDYDLATKKFETFKQSCKKLCAKKNELNNLIKKSKS